MSLQVELCSCQITMIKNCSSSSVQYSIHIVIDDIGTLNFAKVYGLDHSGVCLQMRGVQYSSSSWDNLSTTSVDCISVQCDVIDSPTNSSAIFISNHALNTVNTQISQHENTFFVQKTINLTSLVAHWKPETKLSLISFRYCTPLVPSMRKLGPEVSGPKAQIFRKSSGPHWASSKSAS